MDLIYMDSNRADIGVMPGYTLDLAFGSDENDFKCEVQKNDHCCETGYYIYAEGTEYGGVVDSIEVDGDSGEVAYTGRTWHGILGSKVIEPLKSGEASQNGVTLESKDSKGVSFVGRYLVISGKANVCIQYLVERMGLGDLFQASTEDSASIQKYQFWRYVDGYKGISKMLESAGLRLVISYKTGKVLLSTAQVHDYSQDEEFDPESISMSLTRRGATVNHLVCLGSGEMENRTVIHLYADPHGNISQSQSQFGLAEYTAVYDYNRAESEEDLISAGTEELRRLWEPEKMDISLDDESGKYHIGDKVGATDHITGISAVATIRKKIVKIKSELLTISYEVGE